MIAIVLAIWQPLSFASLTAAVPSLPARGAGAIVEFVWAGVVACVSAAAAWALATRVPAGPALARIAIAFALARDLQALWVTRLPSNVIPGTAKPIAAVTVVVAAMLWTGTLRLERGS